MTHHARSITCLIKAALVALLVGFASEVLAEASPPKPPQVSAESPAQPAQDPTGLDTITVGPLAITPSKTVVRVYRDSSRTCLGTVVRFKMRNTSVGDVKISLFADSIGAIDELGVSLFRLGEEKRTITTGINLLDITQGKWGNAYTEAKAAYVMIGPKQVIEVQMKAYQGSTNCYEDKDSEFLKTYKPKTMTFGATLSIVDAQENETVRSFSFSEAPIKILK